jgi:hypothetical protein
MADRMITKARFDKGIGTTETEQIQPLPDQPQNRVSFGRYINFDVL